MNFKYLLMDYLPKISLNKLYSVIKKNYSSNKSTNQQSKENGVLEPFSIMIKLSLLFFKPEGTKLSIHCNTVIFQEPDLVQGINRYINNDKSIDITKLYIPIIKCLSRYKLNDDYKFLFSLSIMGLEKLKKTYISINSNYSTLTTINSYIALIKSYINGSNLNNMDNMYINNIDITIWKDEDIKLIINYFQKLSENNSDNLTKKYIKVILNIAELKENIAAEMVHKAVELF